MKVQCLVLIAICFMCFSPILPCLAEPDSDIPLHLQPLKYPTTVNSRFEKVKHVLSKPHTKHSRSVSTVLQQVHTKISETNSVPL